MPRIRRLLIAVLLFSRGGWLIAQTVSQSDATLNQAGQASIAAADATARQVDLSLKDAVALALRESPTTLTAKIATADRRKAAGLALAPLLPLASIDSTAYLNRYNLQQFLGPEQLKLVGNEAATAHRSLPGAATGRDVFAADSQFSCDPAGAIEQKGHPHRRGSGESYTRAGGCGCGWRVPGDLAGPGNRDSG